MTYIMDGFSEAFKLLISLDSEIYTIIGLSVFVSLVSTCIAAVFGIVSGMLIGLHKFKLKGVLLRAIYALMALPPVVVGLLTAIVIARRGPLGSLQLMYTPLAMIIAQVILITPIITGNVANAAIDRGRKISEAGYVLGCKGKDKIILVIRELKRDITVAVTAGFGRGISEVGAVMIVGGNIKGNTRVMTTFIAMNNSMGNYSKSLAMGIVLILIAWSVNVIIHRKSEV